MAGITVESTRVVPVARQTAFDRTLPMPLTAIFTRRHALLPPIKQVVGQIGSWAQPGQSRTVVTTDGGTMREELTAVDRPHSFSYHLTDITGPFRLLVDSIDGRWVFAAGPLDGDTVITWRWTLHPRGAGAVAMPLITMMWRGYAKKALEQLSENLSGSASVR
jgi:hypothetical protein